MAEVARYRGKVEAIEDERDRLAVQLADAQAAHLVAIERAAAAEAKLELIEREALSASSIPWTTSYRPIASRPAGSSGADD